jgi:hypothetical protein
MSGVLHYFKSSFIVTILGLVGAYALGGASAVFIVAILSILEVSLSFDNAVVNAAVLAKMDAIWRKRFIVWGMLIAVFGMRIIFPILMVAAIAQISPLAGFLLAVNEPERYAETLTSAHVVVAGFGGTFLLLVFLRFFLDKEKQIHWLRVIESPLTKLGRMKTVEIALALLAIYGVSTNLVPEEQLDFVLASIAGIVTYIVVDGVSDILGSDELGVSSVARAGLSSFLYLEVLDASFSFDGVIGAFALSNDIFIIAIGLGIGAMFVRSLTIMFVEKGALEHFRYLEHGAFYAIGALAALMLVGSFYHISEVIVGLLGAAFIVVSIIASIRYNRKAYHSIEAMGGAFKSFEEHSSNEKQN